MRRASTDRSILVNIPGAQLETVEFGRVYSRHNIVVGKLERPSPTLASKVSDINFNPYWKIPASIVAARHRAEIHGGPELSRRQPHPRLRRRGRPRDRSRCSSTGDDADPERYFFRQEPGAHNSLGTVKINFPNDHMVYMHDTPHRELFGRNVRFESSGCVRIDQVRDRGEVDPRPHRLRPDDRRTTR